MRALDAAGRPENLMPLYRCKPLIVEAIQFRPHVQPWPPGIQSVLMGPTDTCYRIPVANRDKSRFTDYLEIKTGDWIVTNEEGERRVVTDRVFQRLYEPVPDAVPVATSDDDDVSEAITDVHGEVSTPPDDALARSQGRAVVVAAARAGAAPDLAESLAMDAYDAAVDIDRTRDETPRGRKHRR